MPAAIGRTIRSREPSRRADQPAAEAGRRSGLLRVFVKRPDQQAAAGAEPEDLIAGRTATIPMRRPGTADEVANAALFLISDEAS